MTEYVKIKNIEKLETNYDLYDIETKNHNFYANDVLVHNSNGAVCFSNQDGFWVQSRVNIITPEKDNAGCAFYAYSKENEWKEIIQELAEHHNVDLDNNIISVYFEWCGDGIQKNTCVQGIGKKLAIIFEHFKVSPLKQINNDDPNSESSVWLPTNGVSNHEKDIFNVTDFPTFELEIDFNYPALSQNKLVELTEHIEDNSVIGKYFNLEETVGEGIVWTITDGDVVHKFKVKGEKHSKSKVKKLKPVDTEKEQANIDFANYATPGWRLEQMFDLANDTVNGGQPDIKNIGNFMKMIAQDVIKEESDVMIERGLEPKVAMSYVSKVAREWYFDQLNDF